MPRQTCECVRVRVGVGADVGEGVCVRVCGERVCPRACMRTYKIRKMGGGQSEFLIICLEKHIF